MNKNWMKFALVSIAATFCSIATAQSSQTPVPFPGGHPHRPIAEQRVIKIDLAELTKDSSILIQVEFGREVEVDCREFLQGTVNQSSNHVDIAGFNMFNIGYAGSGQIIDRQIGCPDQPAVKKFLSLKSSWYQFNKNTRDHMVVRLMKDLPLTVRYRVVKVRDIEPVVLED